MGDCSARCEAVPVSLFFVIWCFRIGVPRVFYLAPGSRIVFVSCSLCLATELPQHHFGALERTATVLLFLLVGWCGGGVPSVVCSPCIAAQRSSRPLVAFFLGVLRCAPH